jgi:hypothetical protein
VEKGIATVKLVRTVVTDKPLGAVFDYLSDFSTTTDWDPGTISTERLRGDGGVGTTYLNTSKFLGRTTQLTYVVEEFIDRRLIRLRGENKTVVAVDTMTFRVAPSGTEVTYTARFSFKHLSRFVAPLLRPALDRLGNEAATRMSAALDRL